MTDFCFFGWIIPLRQVFVCLFVCFWSWFAYTKQVWPIMVRIISIEMFQAPLKFSAEKVKNIYFHSIFYFSCWTLGNIFMTKSLPELNISGNCFIFGWTNPLIMLTWFIHPHVSPNLLEFLSFYATQNKIFWTIGELW